MVPARLISGSLSRPLCDPSTPLSALMDWPTAPSVLEMLRTDAELPSIGRSRFQGTLRDRNALWRDYRNFLRQAISNYRAALGVDNRSASLLYYYAMLNFAKAELLAVQPSAVRGRVSHGLHFDPTRAKTVRGDSLTVQNGVFRMLYEHRTGYKLPIGTRLPIHRLLARIPEIEQQLTSIGMGPTEVRGVLFLLAGDGSASWSMLGLEIDTALKPNTATGRLFGRLFSRVEAPPEWQRHFSMSRRYAPWPAFYESHATFPHGGLGTASADAASRAAHQNAWSAKDILETATSGTFDAWLSPSLYGPKMLPMPPSLARYAVTYYASSLVRYRPSMFDSQISPQYAYLFDALARECSVPMLTDTLLALTKRLRFFMPDGAFRT
jgi:YaaC-like Protein